MKQLLLTISIALMAISVIAQNKGEVNVSSKVKAELKSLYPDAKAVKWSSHDEGKIDASFKIKGKRIHAGFNADTLFSIMTEIHKRKLPEAVKDHLKTYYKGYSIVQTYEMKLSPKAQDKSIHYWIGLKKGHKETVIVCYADGTEMTGFTKK